MPVSSNKEERISLQSMKIRASLLVVSYGPIHTKNFIFQMLTNGKINSAEIFLQGKLILKEDGAYVTAISLEKLATEVSVNRKEILLENLIHTDAVLNTGGNWIDNIEREVNTNETSQGI